MGSSFEFSNQGSADPAPAPVGRDVTGSSSRLSGTRAAKPTILPHASSTILISPSGCGGTVAHLGR
jgi:hypothetical protein